MTNQKLLAAAAAVLAAYPDAQEVHVCEDGNVFLPERKQLAQAHCTASRLPAPVAVSRKAVEAQRRVVDTVRRPKDEAANAAQPDRGGEDQETEQDQVLADAEEAELDPDVLEAEGRGVEPQVEEEKKVAAKPAPKGKGKAKGKKK